MTSSCNYFSCFPRSSPTFSDQINRKPRTLDSKKMYSSLHQNQTETNLLPLVLQGFELFSQLAGSILNVFHQCLLGFRSVLLGLILKTSLEVRNRGGKFLDFFQSPFFLRADNINQDETLAQVLKQLASLLLDWVDNLFMSLESVSAINFIYQPWFGGS